MADAHPRLTAALLRRQLSLLAPVRGRFAVLVLIQLVMVASIVARPWFLREAIDRGFSPPDAVWLALMAGGLLLVWIARFVSGAMAGLVSSSIARRVLADLRLRAFTHLQALSLDFFDREQAGRIIARVDRDIDALEPAVVHAPPELLATLLRCLAAGALLAALDLRLFCWLLPLAPALLLATGAFQRLAVRAWARVSEARSRTTARLCETIAGVRVVQQSGAGAANHRRYVEEMRVADRAAVAGAWRWGWFQPWVGLLFIIGTAILIVEGGRALAEQRLTLGQLAQCVFYVFLFLGPLQELGDLVEKVATAGASALRVFGLLDEPVRIRDRAGALPMGRAAGAVAWRDVTFRYREGGPPVIDHLTLEVAPGERLALVGPTGHGKSTLVQLLARFYEAQEGVVSIDGRDVREVPQADLRRQVAVVPQDNLLFSGTVLDNLRLARPSADDATLAAAVRELGADEVLEALPRGLATEVGAGGNALSAGQRQLVCLVRAWLADPAILVLDEATSAIDLHTERRIRRALDRLCAGRTAVIVAHRLATIRNADRIAVIRDGRVAELGSHGQLMALGGIYRSMIDSGSTLMDGLPTHRQG